ncbi:ribosome biogenesis GTP-binding protein YihA/YsxC [Rhodohalobacter sulfatireducens]|uniref:Probable GTP-binding protein EngB n=1 Tax=Rhodohalobacter sulfatireducens TaxID=2911366 RepID=A0ABS9KFU9_9BACT|nr:ribosome biogenesis GTP-binding protein YihA/YsxC [Rhodohalobacter sulfatireducens]MCG2589657.1 ribosome biogenesis GTP-binding protein YihA/YsxC [Rhodohalobacter sulfatireducens]
MAFNTSTFVTSAPSLADCPPEDLPEVCFAGRSNVGKSSLINSLVNRKRLARTSNTPGKTQQMNYYNIDQKFYIVDLPGFGFAKVPEKERKRWGKDIKQYLYQRKTLNLILHLVDARHDPTRLDEDFFYWMASNRKPFSVVLTKSDKLSGNKLAASKQTVKKILEKMNIEAPIIVTSSDSGRGIKDLQSLILEFINYK